MDQSSAERSFSQKQQVDSNSKINVVRVNNFVSGTNKARVGSSHSPSGLAAGGSKDSQDSGIL